MRFEPFIAAAADGKVVARLKDNFFGLYVAHSTKVSTVIALAV
jgi:hypothetical protein